MMTIQNGVKEVSCAALLQTIVPTNCPTVVEHGLENIEFIMIISNLP